MENIKEIALNIIEDTCEIDDITDFDLDLYDAGLMDSLSVINIILLIEKKIGIKIQPTDLSRDDISTVNNFISFLERKVKKNC